METIPTEDMTLMQICQRCLVVSDTPMTEQQARTALFYLDGALADSPDGQRRFAAALDFAGIPRLPIQS